MPEACREPALSPGLQLAWRQAHRRSCLPDTLKALNGLKGSRKPCPIPVLAGSREGRGDGGSSGNNTSRGAPWADTKDHPGESCPAFGNHRGQRDGAPREVLDVHMCGGY